MGDFEAQTATVLSIFTIRRRSVRLPATMCLHRPSAVAAVNKQAAWCHSKLPQRSHQLDTRNQKPLGAAKITCPPRPAPDWPRASCPPPAGSGSQSALPVSARLSRCAGCGGQSRAPGGAVLLGHRPPTHRPGRVGVIYGAIDPSQDTKSPCCPASAAAARLVTTSTQFYSIGPFCERAERP